MPIVHINIVEGRPPETIEKLIGAVSHAVADTLGTPLETVRVLVGEMKEHQYGIGGKLIRQVQAERQLAEEEPT